MTNSSDADFEDPANYRGPTWQFPMPLNRGIAVDSMASVAAPLLAGFSITLIGVVAQAPQSFRWPAATLFVLIVVVILMVACVQFGFRARPYLYSPGDIENWWPDRKPKWIIQSLVEQQKGHYAEWLKWHSRARLSYNSAIVVLGIGLALVAVPPLSYEGASGPLDGLESSIRWIAAGLALAGATTELAWILVDNVRHAAQLRRVREAQQAALQPTRSDDAVGDLAQAGERRDER